MGKESSAVWTDPLIDVFCDLCIKEVDNNNRPNTHFNKFGWENLIAGFKQQTGKEYTKKQLKNKWDSLKEQWKLWRDLKGKETGLGWDSTLHNIVATDEWWSAKIEKTPEYAKFKKKGISPEFEAKMDRMFGGTSATGVHAYAPSSSLSLPSSSKGGDNTILLEGSGDSDDSPQASATPTKRRKGEKGKGVATRLSTGSVPSKKEKVGGAAHLANQIDKMVEAIHSRSTATSVAQKESSGTGVKEVMKVIRTLPGVEVGTELYYFACRFFRDPVNREMFSTMVDDDPKDIVGWLEFEFKNK